MKIPAFTENLGKGVIFILREKESPEWIQKAGEEAHRPAAVMMVNRAMFQEEGTRPEPSLRLRD